MQQTLFKIGDDYEVEIKWSQLGLEIYLVNGKEVLRKRSFSMRGTRKFTAGEGEDKHDIEIKVDMIPTLKSLVSSKDWIAQAYVDGELVVSDLIPQFRKIDKILNWIIVTLIGFIAFCFILVFLLQQITQHFNLI